MLQRLFFGVPPSGKYVMVESSGSEEHSPYKGHSPKRDV